MSATPPSRPGAAATAGAPVQRRKPRYAPHANSHDEGDGNWLMSYADMMTLLMAFFAIMFSFSKVDQQAFDQIRQTVSMQFGGKFQMPFQEIYKSLKEVIEKEELSKKVKVEQDGSGISIVFQGTVFFEAGGVNLSDESKPILGRILDLLAQKVREYPIYVEGHTDDSPITTAQFPSNWELSAVRASAVVRMLESRGFERKNLHPQGWADSKPMLPNRDAEGKAIPENQAQNRRVILRILKT